MTEIEQFSAASLGVEETGWEAVFEAIAFGWGRLPDGADDAYRALLSGRTPDEVLEALRMLAEDGFRFCPRPPDILRKLNADPGKPTFEEAFRLIFGRGGVLKARPRRARYADGRERARAERDAMLERAAGMHRYVAAFVATYGIDRLRLLPVNDPDWGWKRREELQEAWDAFVLAADEREAAGRALRAVGRGTGGELAKLDPLKALGLGGGALGPGDGS